MDTMALPTVTDDQKKQYTERGYLILESALSVEALALLRANCMDALDDCHALMDQQGTDVVDLTHRNKRYFLRGHAQRSVELRRFLFSPLMEMICRETIGDTAFLFFEQFVMKVPEKGMEFAWHQDAGYVQVQHKPFVTCWIALDDVYEENGTVYLLPLDEMDKQEVKEHVKQEGTNDLVGYTGSQKGIPAIMPAGSILAFSSLVLHRSGANISKNSRSVFIGHYAPHLLFTEEGTRVGFGVPFLNKGNRVCGETGPPPDSEAWTTVETPA